MSIGKISCLKLYAQVLLITEIWLGISCESAARQMIQMKCRAILSLKHKKKKGYLKESSAVWFIHPLAEVIKNLIIVKRPDIKLFSVC